MNALPTAFDGANRIAGLAALSLSASRQKVAAELAWLWRPHWLALGRRVVLPVLYATSADGARFRRARMPFLA